MADTRQQNQPQQPSEFQENVISIDRVARVVKGGRRFRFRALVVVGDGKQRVGVGVSKGSDVQMAISKAIDDAKKNFITVPITEAGTIPHEITARQTGAKVFMKPASQGTGLIAGGTMRAVLEVTGITDVLSKSLGSNNKINAAYATINALKALKPESEWVTTRQKQKNEPKTKEAAKETTATSKPKKKAAVTSTTKETK